MAPPMNLDVVVHNNTKAPQLFAHVTGTADNGLFFLSADGLTPYHPPSPSSGQQPLGQDCAISIGGPGQSKTLRVPRLTGARIWFSEMMPLTFLLNPGPAVVEPSVTNPQDPNYHLVWTFCEFTLDAAQLYVNISYVDFVSLPVSLRLQNASGQVTSVEGMPQDGLDTVCNQLADHGHGWERLVIKGADGANLRALSANSGHVMFGGSGLFDGYYQPYVDRVWAHYQGDTQLRVDTQGSWGEVHGSVVGGRLTFGDMTFDKPSAADVFSCSTGPFAAGPGVSPEKLNIGARLAAALNRSTLLTVDRQPEGGKVDDYYKDAITNHYARICHATSLGGSGYAFPYDDVGPSHGEDQSGFLSDPNPAVLTIGVGAPL